MQNVKCTTQNDNGKWQIYLSSRTPIWDLIGSITILREDPDFRQDDNRCVILHFDF